MRIAIEGCAHGELEKIYDAITLAEQSDGKKIDLLICCGDFQSTRNSSDLQCMSVPNKYKEIGTFYKYYSGEKVAPVLTIFIGGNHEASNYLQELPYGGWVAPNIYYLGYASVINIAGLRIAGISGIYKAHDYYKGHYEKPPYDKNSIRSVYHVRKVDIVRLKQLSGKVDIFISHDWPEGITQYGDVNDLLKKKPFFRDDISKNCLGSPPSMELLEQHRPSYWFAAHLHCKFAAMVPEKDNLRETKFLALDKCLPKRKFLQILSVEHHDELPIELSYDLEWLTILYLTNHWLSTKSSIQYMPATGDETRNDFTPTKKEKDFVLQKFKDGLKIPENFKRTVDAYDAEQSQRNAPSPSLTINDQTSLFCDTLGIDDPFALLQMLEPSSKNWSQTSAASENSFEQSFASDMTESNVSDSSLVCIDTSGSSVLKRSFSSMLKLPAASNDFPDLKEKPEESENKSCNEESTCLTDTLPLSALEPHCKKFTRRNQSIYSDTS